MTVSSTSLMDGINRHILAIAPKLNSRAGTRVVVVTLLPRGELNEALEKQGVSTITMNAPNGHFFPITWRFRRLMEEFKPDIVHVHVIAFWEAVIAKRFFPKIRYLVTVHGISDPPKRITLKARVEQWLSVFSELPVSARICVSHGVMNALQKSCVPARVLYNPIDFSYQPIKGTLRRELGLSDEVPLVGTACRIAEVKNPVAFTRVMCAILEKCNEAHAVVIGAGDPPLDEKIRQIAADSAVNGRMHFLGFRTDARDLIADLNCFVLTSRREGMPTALLEAMAAKVPVAFWEGEGGLCDLTDFNEREGSVAVVAKQGDEAALAGGIREWLLDPEKARLCANRAFDAGARYFDVDYVVSELVVAYGDLL